MSAVPFYEEKQTNPVWMGWGVVMAGAGALVFLLIQLMERWDSAADTIPEEAKGLLAAVIVTVITAGVAAWLVFCNHLTVSIDRGGVTYLFWPVFTKPRHISADLVERFVIRKISLMEYLSSARNRRAMRAASPKIEVCIIRSFTVAELVLRDGRKVILGTENPDGLERALKKLQAND